MPSALHSIADAVIKRIHRSPLYYGRFNNTLSYRINMAYIKYARECAEKYRAEHPNETFDASPFATDAGRSCKGAFPADKARAYSQKISAMIERNDENVIRASGAEKLAVHINNPLRTLGTDILDVLRDPDVDRALRSFFRGYYRVHDLGASRSFPSKEVTSSWLWHSDSFPPYTCKLFLHLTPANAERGATQFMSLADTMAYRRAGYFGQFRDERYASLEEFAAAHHLPYRPYHFDAEPGDATLFNMNFFHRAVPPINEFRDIVSFYFLPSPVPWEEFYEQNPERLMREKKSGFPKDPRPDAESGAVGMM